MNFTRQTKKLDEVCDFYNGLWKGKEPPFTEVGVVRNTNFTKDGKLDDSNIAYLDVETKQFDKRKLIYGDIILEKSGGGPKQPVGRVVIFDKNKGKFSFSNFTSAIRIKNSNELDFNFLHRFLFFSYISGITEKMQSHSTGIRNLDTKLYKNIEIPIPPLLEQQRIVKILDSAFESIAKARTNTEKNLQDSKIIFESYLDQIISHPEDNWEVKKLDDVCKKITDGSHYSPKNTDVGEYPYITVRDINNDQIDFDHCKYIDEKSYKSLLKNDCQPLTGDVLFSKDGTVGKVSLVNFERSFVVLSSLAIVRPNPIMIKSTFLKFILKSPTFLHEAVGKKTGAAIRRIILKNLKQISITFPKSLSAQENIVSELNTLSEETKKLELVYQQKLADLEELKKSVLKKAFSGEL